MTSSGSVPRPRLLTERFFSVSYAIGIAALASVAVAAGVVIYVAAISGPPHPAPGNTPLREVFTVGTGVGTCAAGNATFAWNCSYAFGIVTVSSNGAPTLTLGNLDFEALDSSGVILSSPFSVTIIRASGCGLGSYNSSVNAWGPSTFPAPCGPSYDNTTPLQSGDSLTLAAIPRGGLPFSGVGDQLLVIGVGEFAGSVSASFD
jgi:hypothetical protein